MSGSFDNSKSCLKEHLCKYFAGDIHNSFTINVTITLISRKDGSDYTKSENYWLRNLKTYAPYKINVMSAF